jgi:hypothetical protein
VAVAAQLPHPLMGSHGSCFYLAADWQPDNFAIETNPNNGFNMFIAAHIFDHGVSSNQRGQWNKVIGSGIYFSIAWVIMNYLMSGVSACFAWSLGYSPTFSLDGLSSLAATTGWCGSYIAKVFATAPIAAMLISIVSWVLFNLTNPFRTHLRTIIFWLSVAGFLVYYAHIVAGLIYLATGIPRLFMGFVAMYTWARWETETIAIVLVLQAVISLAWPLLFVPQISKLSPSRSLLEDERGKAYLFQLMFLIPMAIGLVLMMAASFPFNLHYLIIQSFTCMLVIVIVYLGFQLFHNPMLQIVKGGMTERPAVYYITLTLALVAIARFVLSIPVRSFM